MDNQQTFEKDPFLNAKIEEQMVCEYNQLAIK
jgi:hypothetical protein